jgi:hypothetical protein
MNNDMRMTEPHGLGSALVRDGLPTSGHRWPRRLCWLAPIAVLILGAMWLVLTAFLARDNLEAAKEEASSLTSLVRDGRIAEARSMIDSLQTHADRAHRLTTGPAWFLASNVPLLGEPLHTARGLSAATDQLSAQALRPLVDLADSVNPASLRRGGDQINIAALTTAEPGLGKIRDSLVQIQAQVSTLPASGWANSVNSARTDVLGQLDGLTRTVTAAHDAARILPVMLGRYGTMRYFIGLQNEAEARGTGGLPGAFAVVEAAHGKLKFTHFENDTALAGVTTGLNFGADFEGRYGVADPTNFYVNSNISPHFPYAAETWAAMWQRKSGERVDGAIAVDPSALSYFLAVTGPAKLADGSSITAANIVAKTQQEPYQRFGDNAQRKAYLLEVAESVDKRLLSGDGDPTKLVRAATRAAGERRLLVWSSHPDVQAVLMNSDFGGTVPDTSAPFVGLTVINASGNKLDYYLDRSVQWQRSGCGPSRSVTATVTLTNNAPASGLSTYVTGRNDNPSYATKPGDNRILVSYFATEGATLEAATMNGKVKAVFPQRENGHPVYEFDVELPRGVPQTLTLSLKEPAGIGDPWLIKQPLVRPLQMSILDQKCA